MYRLCVSDVTCWHHTRGVIKIEFPTFQFQLKYIKNISTNVFVCVQDSFQRRRCWSYCIFTLTFAVGLAVGMEPRFTLSRLGKPVLDIGKCRYYKNNRSSGVKAAWFCSKRRLGCRASVVIVDGIIINVRNTHCHDVWFLTNYYHLLLLIWIAYY